MARLRYVHGPSPGGCASSALRLDTPCSDGFIEQRCLSSVVALSMAKPNPELNVLPFSISFVASRPMRV
jgi:hypothetical protein